ncbi:hypothetical protein BDU57DRAFT_508365 [Ampelomyces quisqualis]|uniref:Uncharacterized protein n=1 Tax=Ampelomyces quisqualis TaxID=50730 RepID=A0A6A5QWT1_AMPQU|nr:hypothetical protein BDU57DRAFT_508365 [Ampelomyces quisqualis]
MLIKPHTYHIVAALIPPATTLDGQQNSSAPSETWPSPNQYSLIVGGYIFFYAHGLIYEKKCCTKHPPSQPRFRPY